MLTPDFLINAIERKGSKKNDSRKTIEVIGICLNKKIKKQIHSLTFLIFSPQYLHHSH